MNKIKWITFTIHIAKQSIRWYFFFFWYIITIELMCVCLCGCRTSYRILNFYLNLWISFPISKNGKMFVCVCIWSGLVSDVSVGGKQARLIEREKIKKKSLNAKINLFYWIFVVVVAFFFLYTKRKSKRLSTNIL